MEQTKELTVLKAEVSKVQLSFDEVMKYSEVFSKSGMFEDAKDAAKAFVKIMAGQEIGIPCFASMAGVFIIKGKTTIGAGLMAAAVDSHPNYSYEVKKLDETGCVLIFFKDGKKKGESSFSAEDAKKALTQNTEKFPRNMFFARAMSNGIKWYAPGVFAGPVYTPEEMQVIDITHEEVIDPNKPNPTPQPEITNHVHSVNSIKKSETADELLASWSRTDEPTRSHPDVMQERDIKIFQLMNSCKTSVELANVCKATKPIIEKDAASLAAITEEAKKLKINLIPKK